MKPRKIRQITTSGPGYIPPAQNPPFFDKRKIYNRLPADVSNYVAADPFGITVGMSALLQYFLNSDDTIDRKINAAKDALAKPEHEIIKNAKKLNMDEQEYYDLYKDNKYNLIGLEDAKDVYLGMPQRSGTFVPSQYTPTTGDYKSLYSSTILSSPDVIERWLLPAYHNLKNRTVSGKTMQDPNYRRGDLISLGKSGSNALLQLPILGNSTIGAGIDDKKGPYLSYYDDWDIELSGASNGKDVVSRFIGGQPFSIYDRIYLDDYYGVDSSVQPGDYYGGYLPEVTVKPLKRK